MRAFVVVIAVGGMFVTAGVAACAYGYVRDPAPIADDCDPACHAAVRAALAHPAHQLADYEQNCSGVQSYAVYDRHTHTFRAEPITVDGTPNVSACWATFRIACPPDCERYKDLIEATSPGVVRME